MVVSEINKEAVVSTATESLNPCFDGWWYRSTTTELYDLYMHPS